MGDGGGGEGGGGGGGEGGGEGGAGGGAGSQQPGLLQTAWKPPVVLATTRLAASWSYARVK